jgi:predicted protein tyrosine phosphatase
MNQIIILPKTRFKQFLETYNINEINVEKFNKIAFISIIEPDGLVIFEKDYLNFITLQIWDIEEEIEYNNKILKPMNKDQADKIIKFIMKHIYNVNSFIIHCSAGISRSGAIGVFILDYLQSREYSRERIERFKIINPNILPNRYILNLLNKTIRKETYEV